MYNARSWRYIFKDSALQLYNFLSRRSLVTRYAEIRGTAVKLLFYFDSKGSWPSLFRCASSGLTLSHCCWSCVKVTTFSLPGSMFYTGKKEITFAADCATTIVCRLCHNNRMQEACLLQCSKAREGLAKFHAFVSVANPRPIPGLHTRT
jgi:hypothetical protein